MKRRKSFKASFVVTVAGTASFVAVSAGCGVGNPPPVSRPETLPTSGESCNPDTVPEECTYPDECGLDIVATCDAGSWTVEYSGTCNPPPVLECPALIPTVGDACFGEGSCTYSDECGFPVTASCPTGAWDVQYEGTCDQPPPCDIHDMVDTCIADPNCRWLVPGCVDPEQVPLPQEGCYPMTPCLDDTECAGLACTEVFVVPACDTDPCACGEPTSVCM